MRYTYLIPTKASGRFTNLNPRSLGFNDEYKELMVGNTIVNPIWESINLVPGNGFYAIGSENVPRVVSNGKIAFLDGIVGHTNLNQLTSLTAICAVPSKFRPNRQVNAVGAYYTSAGQYGMVRLYLDTSGILSWFYMNDHARTGSMSFCVFQMNWVI